MFFCLASCQSEPQTGTAAVGTPVKLKIAPLSSSRHFYDISNETGIETEVNGKEVETRSRSDVGVSYNTTQDSAGNYIVSMNYDKILVYTKTGDQETELNADNAAISINPAEKILGYLKDVKLVAVLDEKGQTKEVQGYKELGEKITAGFAANDTYGKAMAQKQWNDMIRQQVVDNNLKQVFGIFPDSIIRIGQEWKTTSRYKEQFNLTVDNTYTLKAVKDSLATVQVKGKIRSENGAAGAFNTNADLNGEQQGTYKIDLRTGMPVEVEIASTVEGKMQAMGKEVPLLLRNKVTIKRREKNG